MSEISGFDSELLKIRKGNLSKLKRTKNQSVNQPRKESAHNKINIQQGFAVWMVEGCPDDGQRRLMQIPPPHASCSLYIGHAWPCLEGGRPKKRAPKRNPMEKKKEKKRKSYPIWSIMLINRNSVLLHFCVIFLFG